MNVITAGAAFIALWGLVILNSTLKVTQTSANTAHDALVQTQRAWVQITADFSPALKDIKEVTYRMKLANVGNTPAKRIDVRNIVRLVKSDEPPPFSVTSMGFGIEAKVIFPKADTSYPVSLVRPDNSIAILTPTERGDLENGKSYIAIYGSAVYEDEFGFHWTHFCFWKGYANGIYASEACVSYNDVGEGKNPY